MTYEELLTRVINDGIASVKADKRLTAKRQEGSILGFEQCRGKTPEELRALLREAEQTSIRAQHEDMPIEEYWKLRYVAVQIEWVCNTLSAALYNQGLPTIIPPTARGMMNAARILGVRADGVIH